MINGNGIGDEFSSTSNDDEEEISANQDLVDAGFLDPYKVHLCLGGNRDQFVHETWKLDSGLEGSGKLHRPNGPAKITTDRETGTVLREAYYNFGKKHRNGGPAVREIDFETGVVTLEEYYIDGKLSNADGPAVIVRDKTSGEVLHQKYFDSGVEQPKGRLDFSL